MFCRNCGKQLEDNAIICPQCGVEVNPSNSTGYNNRNYNNNYNQNYNQSYNNQQNNNQGYYNQQSNAYQNGSYNNAGAYAPRPAPRDTSNSIAIVGFVLSFFFALAGLICSIIGYNKAKNEGLDNKGFALAGIIISVIEICSFIFGLFLLIGLPIILGWYMM